MGQIFRQNPVSEWILMMRSLNWISAKFLISALHEWEIWLRSNEWISWIKIHPLTGFCLIILWCFLEYIYSKIVYFYLKYYGLFLYSKGSRSPITASIMFHITAPWCHSKHPLSYHNGFVMLSRQLCDITMDWWCCHWYQTIIWQTAWIFYTRSRKT